MWTLLVAFYVLGLAATAAVVLRNQVSGQNRVFNAGALALWPLYWTWFLLSLFLNRTR
jgi:hypothetical protein